jgi:hypothetical protein
MSLPSVRERDDDDTMEELEDDDGTTVAVVECPVITIRSIAHVGGLQVADQW